MARPSSRDALVLVGAMALALARRYRRSVDDLAAALRASSRFVPQPFLGLLGLLRE